MRAEQEVGRLIRTGVLKGRKECGRQQADVRGASGEGQDI